MPPQSGSGSSAPATSAEAPTLRNLTSKSWGRPAASQNELLQSLGKPHVESFNFMLDQGLNLAVADLEAVEFAVPETGQRIGLRVTDATLAPPTVVDGAVGIKEPRVFPTEARQRGTSYKGRFTIS